MYGTWNSKLKHNFLWEFSLLWHLVSFLPLRPLPFHLYLHCSTLSGPSLRRAFFHLVFVFPPSELIFLPLPFTFSIHSVSLLLIHLQHISSLFRFLHTSRLFSSFIMFPVLLSRSIAPTSPPPTRVSLDQLLPLMLRTVAVCCATYSRHNCVRFYTAAVMSEQNTPGRLF